TGAVFAGDGSFVLNPPTEAERKSLKYLTKEDQFNEKFERLVLRFTDSTYDQIKKDGTPASGGCDRGLLKDSQNTTRHKIKTNLAIGPPSTLPNPTRGAPWAGRSASSTTSSTQRSKRTALSPAKRPLRLSPSESGYGSSRSPSSTPFASSPLPLTASPFLSF